MTRWLRAAQEGPGALTKPTELTKPLGVGAAQRVLSVLSVLSGGGEAAGGATGDDLHDLLDAWEERAAIREYDGGQTREEAERDAAREVGLNIDYWPRRR